MFCKDKNMNNLDVQREFRPQNRTNRATDIACSLRGRKAVYRADTRSLCKENVKQTALAPIGSFDLDRP